MTNPAVEALKQCPFCSGDGQITTGRYLHENWASCTKCKTQLGGTWTSRAVAIAAWNRRAQAERTPVAGQLISEELWAYLIEYCEASQPLVALCTKSGDTPRLLKNLEALRASPSFPKEGE